jgi:hypothetical protein
MRIAKDRTAGRGRGDQDAAIVKNAAFILFAAGRGAGKRTCGE